MSNKKVFVFILVFSTISVVLRFVPHAPNFVPIGALALFVGMYATRKWQIILPLVVMFASDIFIGFYDLRTMMVVYFGFLVFILAGRLVKKHKNVFTVVAGVLGGSVFFYLSTNFAVWAFSNMYQHTISGLILSYEMAVPFFRNSVLGDIFYTGVFVSVYELASAYFASSESKFKKLYGKLKTTWSV